MAFTNDGRLSYSKIEINLLSIIIVNCNYYCKLFLFQVKLY